MKLWKIILGLLTLVPGVYIFFFMFGMDGMSFDKIGRLHIAAMILMFALTAVYLVLVNRTPELSRDSRALWSVVVLLGGFIGQLVFFWFYLRGGERRA